MSQQILFIIEVGQL